MVNSKPFQLELKQALERHFSTVRKEWPVSEWAKDALGKSRFRYAPRLDIAVGKPNVLPGNRREDIKKEFTSAAPPKLRKYVEGLCENQNPRCAMAIEIAFSGSQKHMLGDITNASMMGLYGFVIASDDQFRILERVLEYVKVLKGVHKASRTVFNNVAIMRTSEFMGLL